MKLSSIQKKSRGFALLSLLACLLVILIVFASIMHWITTNGTQTQRNETFTSSEAAAEGESELIFAHMDRDYLYGNLNTSSNFYGSWLPTWTNNWPVQYTFSNSVILGVQQTNLNYLGSEYTNLLGFPQTNIVTITATPIGQTYNVPASVSQTYVFAAIPAFQFAIFYNMDLEIDPGAQMPITGAVFSNGGIWSGTPNVTYSWTVEAAGQVNLTGTDPFMTGKTDSGTPEANFLYTGTPAQPESDVNPLIIPIGASGVTNNSSGNVEAIINIPPASVAAPQSIAYAPTNQTYDFNAASLIVSNWYWGINGVAPWSNNFTVYLQDSVTAPSAVQVNGVATNWVMLTNDFYIISNKYHGNASLWPNNANPIPTNYVPNFRFAGNMSLIRWTNTIATNGPVGTNCVWYAGFSFLTETNFTDYRESANVDAVLLDVGKLAAWINAGTPNGGSNWSSELCQDTGEHGINSIFIDNAVPFIGQQQLPAVQVCNGWQLPCSTNFINLRRYVTQGLTVVTPQPLYVWGSYNVQTNGGPVVLGSQNTVNTYPAAFLADAITILSSNWNDGGESSTLGSRGPVATTVNAGCLEGIVPSYGANYCGGVENFLRLLENWSSSTPLTYNGSIMVMFPSIYATNIWQETGNYYNAPKRVWGFDTNFLSSPLLPALTPQFRAVIRNTWAGY